MRLPGDASSPRKLLILGIDALDPDLVAQGVANGYLPTLERLSKLSISGRLAAATPPITYPSWLSMFTGRSEGSLGIFGFRHLHPDHTASLVAAHRLRGQFVWDAMSAAGRSAAVLFFPLLQRPYHIEGLMVSDYIMGPLRATPADYPLSANLVAHEVVGQPRRLIDLESRNTRQAFAFLKNLLAEGRFEMVAFFTRLVDIVGHLGGEKDLRDAYRLIDGLLGDLAPACEGYNVFIVSDHGGSHVSRGLNINAFLHGRGYLAIKGRHPLLWLGEKLRGILPRAVVRAGAAMVKSHLDRYLLEPQGILGHVSWPRTKALGFFETVSGVALVWLNRVDRFRDGIVPEGDVAPLVERLSSSLLALVDPATNECPIQAVQRYQAPAGIDGSLPPDVIIEAKPGYLLESSLMMNLFPRRHAYCHSREGVILAWGPDIARGGSIDGARVYDVAPTLLHLLGLSVPAETEGRVLAHLFASGSHTAEQPVQYSRTPLEQRTRDAVRRLRRQGKI